MIDSGACYHIVVSRALTPAQTDLIRKPARPHLLETANGLTVADKELDVKLDGLGMEVRALVLENSPRVLSLWGSSAAPRVMNFIGYLVNLRC